MYAESKEIVFQPAHIVYPMVRDDLPKLVPYMPNVNRIEVISYERKSETRVEIMNHWSSVANVPFLLKSFIKPEIFSWKDYATWKDDEYCVDYRLESFMANNLYDLEGTNYFAPADKHDRTEIRITFNLDIYPQRLPGVPGFLATKVKPVIEELIKRILTPNLTALAKGLNAYFAANPPS